jgi:hypothetical protein
LDALPIEHRCFEQNINVSLSNLGLDERSGKLGILKIWKQECSITCILSANFESPVVEKLGSQLSYLQKIQPTRRLLDFWKLWIGCTDCFHAGGLCADV